MSKWYFDKNNILRKRTILSPQANRFGLKPLKELEPNLDKVFNRSSLRFENGK